ncbi:hypothetical protein [Falsiroseomonas sp.]|uniref:hypothetical protein n=1 Tax=Falsiroseomonas sp. TaxID=2870721 RepID=UPI003564086F
MKTSGKLWLLLPTAALACGLVAMPLAQAGAQGRGGIPSFPDYGSDVPPSQQGQVFGGDRGWNQRWREDRSFGPGTPSGEDWRGRMGMGGALPWYRDSEEDMARMQERMRQGRGEGGMGGRMAGDGPNVLLLMIERDRQQARLEEARRAVGEARQALQRDDQPGALGALDRAEGATRMLSVRQEAALERLLQQAQRAVQQGNRQQAQLALLEARLVLRGEDDVAPGRNLWDMQGAGGQSGGR